MATPARTPGESLFDELLWVHGAIRADLEKVRGLAADAVAGAPPERIGAAVGELRTNSPLWQLKAGCFAHCRFVHHHHRLEDMALFPALRRANPELGPVVDKLESDHRSIAARVDEVEAAVAALDGAEGIAGGEPAEGDGDDRAARERLAGALETLAGELLEHLGYEEESVAATMRAMDGL